MFKKVEKGAKTKPVIGVDLDDVLLVLTPPLLAFRNKTHGTSYGLEHMTSFDLDKVWACTREDADKTIIDYYDTDAHKNSLPVPGAREAIAELSQDYSIVIITAKPDSIRTLTEGWLQKYYPDLFTGLYFTNHFGSESSIKKTKVQLCEELGVELFIDDSLTNVIAIAESGRKVLVLDNPWNQTDSLPKNAARVTSWKEALEAVHAYFLAKNR